MSLVITGLLVAVVHIASAVPVGDNEPDFKYPRYIDFHGEDSELRIIDLETEPDMELLNEIQRNPANNQYLLFTRRNEAAGQYLVFNDVNSIRASNFNPQLPIVVIAHGWLSDRNSDINIVIRNAYLAKSDVNIIVLDWGRLASSNYVSASNGVPNIGRGLGQFLNFLISTSGASFNNVHLVGFSLGAHLVGNAGRELGGRVARITGLDPAGPLWSYNSNRLSSGDAVYVEAIHTDGGYTVGGLGIGTALADVDWFPNGGISQPGCWINTCNHSRAWQFFAATVSYNHLIGNECSSSWQITWNSCQGTLLPMGNDDLRKRGSGRFRVNTGRNYPF